MGLGNPGPRYAGTRHNVGFRVLACLASRHSIPLVAGIFAGDFGVGRIASVPVGLLAPANFMNRSGESVSAALCGLPGVVGERDLIVVYDDLDLPLGQLRLRAQGGAGGHRGLESVIEQLGHSRFARLRFGIGRPPAGGDVIEHVLADFSPAEEELLSTQLPLAAEALECFIGEGIAPAMDRYNRARPAAP